MTVPKFHSVMGGKIDDNSDSNLYLCGNDYYHLALLERIHLSGSIYCAKSSN